MRAPRTSRPALVLACLIVMDGAYLASRAGTPQRSKARETELHRGVSVDRTIAGDESHVYTLALNAGDFVDLLVDQRGVDVNVTLADPDEREILSVDARFDDTFRDEAVVAIAHKTGRYTVTIGRVSETEPRGQYSIRLLEVRPATGDDSWRLEAEKAFTEALRIRNRSQAETLGHALSDLTSALEKFRRVRHRSGELKALIEIGATEYYLLDAHALQSARAAETLARRLGDTDSIGRTLRLLGNILIWRGELSEATTALTEANEIARSTGNRRAESRSLNELGRIYMRSGELENAIATFERALSTARAASDDALENTLVANLALAFKLIGAYDRARQAFERSLARARARNDIRAQVGDLINLGNLDRAARDNAMAGRRYEEALTLARRAGLTAQEASALSALGRTYLDRRDFAAALRYQEESLTIRKRIGDRHGEAVALTNLGVALHGLGALDRAGEALDAALATFREVGNETERRDAHDSRARLDWDRGDLTSALVHAREAVSLEERLRRRITSPELRTTFGSTGVAAYELLIDLVMLDPSAEPSARAAAALEISERARARVLLESMLEARVDLRAGIESALLERERRLQREISEAATAVSRTLGGSEGQRTSAASKLRDLSDEYDALQRQIRQQSPRYAALTQPEPLTLTAIQNDVLDADTVLLEFALGDKRSWLWAVTRESITSVELPARAEVERSARLLYEQMTARQRRTGETYMYLKRLAEARQRLPQTAAALSQMLLGGIADQLNERWRGKRLVVVAAGVLEYVPFGALPLPLAGTRPAPAVPLLMRHEIVTVPSASVLATMRRERESREPPTPATIAVLADPVYERTDPRVTSHRTFTVRTLTAPTPASSSPVTRVVVRINEAGNGAGITRLLFSRREANAIAALARGRAFKAIDFEASRATATSPTVSTAQIVHFATHGWLDAEHPELTALVLSLVDERGRPRNGLLRLHDIYDMKLRADLVVLSACQTALGKDLRGEGLVSLTRAFMYAGAPRIVASLWQISDAATAELMKRFYARMLTQGLAPAAALRSAQLEMMRDPKWASPYYWAGFTLHGDWRAASSQTNP